MVSDSDLVTIHALRCPQILEQLSVIPFKEEEFNGPLFCNGTLICIALNHYRLCKEAPPKLAVEVELEKSLSRLSAVPQSSLDKFKTVIAWAYSMPEVDLAPKYILEKGLLQKFIDEVKLGPASQQLASITDATERSTKIREMHQNMEQTRLVANKPLNIFSEEGRRQCTGIQLVPTGIKYLDMLTDGGMRPSCLFGVLAESSGGKTMFGVQYQCEQAMQKKRVLGLFYEQSLEGDISERFYTYLLRIENKEIKGRSSDDYSSDLKKRLDEIDRDITPYLGIHDMSGSVRGQGNGGTAEIEALVQRQIRDGCKPDVIVIDWLGPMVVKAFAMTNNAGITEKREKIDYAMNELCRLKDAYDLTICVLHQIAPAMIESKTPAHKPDWTVASECKSFGLMTDYVFTFGRKCSKTNCMWINGAKSRSAPKGSRIVRMDATRSRIVDVDGEYEGYDASMGRREGQYFGSIGHTGGPG